MAYKVTRFNVIPTKRGIEAPIKEVYREDSKGKKLTEHKVGNVYSDAYGKWKLTKITNHDGSEIYDLDRVDGRGGKAVGEYDLNNFYAKENREDMSDEELKDVYNNMNESEKTGFKFGMIPQRLMYLKKNEHIKLMEITEKQ